MELGRRIVDRNSPSLVLIIDATKASLQHNSSWPSGETTPRAVTAAPSIVTIALDTVLPVCLIEAVSGATVPTPEETQMPRALNTPVDEHCVTT